MFREPMRVLQVIGAMDRGGAETLIMNLYRNVDRTKVQFDFLVNENKVCDYDSEIESLGGRLFRIPRYKIANYLEYKASCKAFFDSNPYKVVHGHIGLPASIYLREASRSGAFTIAHSHAQNYPLSPGEIVFRICSLPVRREADYFLACSQDAGRDRFGDKIVASSSFHVLKNGVDAENMAFDSNRRSLIRAELDIDEGAPVFGHVGRLTEVKNHKFLLDVFEIVHHAVPSSKLLLVGKGELENELRKIVEVKGLSDSVLFVGLREDVSSLLSAMDVFLFPSFSEGLSCAVIEAQTSGLPVLLSTGVPESAAILPSAERLDLSMGAPVWAKRALGMFEEHRDSDRGSAKLSVLDAGFDIKESASWIQELYLQHA